MRRVDRRRGVSMPRRYSKLEKARTLGVDVIDEAELLRRVGATA